jgi:hypothetical protein
MSSIGSRSIRSAPSIACTAPLRRAGSRTRAPQLVTATHHRLAERLGVAGDEVKSIIRLVSSQLEVSVARLLAED